MESGERLYSVREVSEARNLPVYQVREVVALYEVPYWKFKRSNGKVGRKWWLRLSDFDAALERTKKVVR